MLAVLLLAFFSLSSATFGQGTISDGAVSYSFKVVPENEFDNGDLFVEGVDHLFESSWYFRLGSDGFETRLRLPDTESYVDNVATLSWNDIDFTGRVDATLTITIMELSAGLGTMLMEEFEVTNTGTTLAINLYGYSDLDLTEDETDDQAVSLPSPTQMSVFDTTTIMLFEGLAADAFQVTETQLPGTLRDFLADGVADDLNNTGLPFGPGDWEGAYQWSTSLGAASSFTAVKITALEPLLIFADGFESGDTLMWE